MHWNLERFGAPRRTHPGRGCAAVVVGRVGNPPGAPLGNRRAACQADPQKVVTSGDQILVFLPKRRSEFQKCAIRHAGDRNSRGFSCWNQFLCLAFAQLTYRESLRDIEACLITTGASIGARFESALPSSPRCSSILLALCMPTSRFGYDLNNTV